MFPRSFFLLPATVCSVVAVANAADSNISLANEIIDLLSATEICLNTCRDAQSVQAALPQLQQLAQKAADIKNRQAAMQNLTPAEDKEIAKLIRTFSTLTKAIDEHLKRIAASGLMTPELAAVLGYSGENSPPTTN